MKTLEQLYQDLELYKDFNVGDNVEDFLDTTDEIILRKDRESIPILLKYFDDENDCHWAFVSLSSAMEYYESEVYVCGILTGLPVLMKKAPEFASDFFNIIVFTEDCREFLKRHLDLAPKRDLLSVIESLEKYYDAPSKEGSRKTIQEIKEIINNKPD